MGKGEEGREVGVCTTRQFTLMPFLYFMKKQNKTKKKLYTLEAGCPMVQYSHFLTIKVTLIFFVQLLIMVIWYS